MKIKKISIQRDVLRDSSPKIIAVADHTAGVKLNDIFVTDEKFPLMVKSITETEDILVPCGYWRCIKFDDVTKVTIEELAEVKNYEYRKTTPEEQKKLTEESAWL